MLPKAVASPHKSRAREEKIMRGRKLHVLKIEDDIYVDVVKGDKTAELRLNDRDFKCGDLIHFTDVNGYEFPYNPVLERQINLFVICHICPVTRVMKSTPETENYVMLSIKRL